MEKRRVQIFENKKNEVDNSYRKVLVDIGVFLTWGIEVLESSCGVASYTTAIVEKDDGSVYVTSPQLIKFIK